MAKRIDWGPDEEFIKNYKQLNSSRAMGELYHCNKSSVLNHAKKIGFDPNSIKVYKLSDHDKEEIIAAYNIMTSTELAKKYNVSRGMITKLWYDAGLRGKENKGNSARANNLIGQTFGELTVVSKSNKRAANGGIYWLCKCVCGQEKEILGQSLISGCTMSCGCQSNISQGNKKIAKILSEANILFEQEKRFDTCRDINTLPFDFYVDNKYLIEYDGEQHFDKNSFFNYEYTHTHDKIKSKWCKDNNIPLIRIPYTRYNYLCLEDLLLDKTKFLEENNEN